MAKYEIWCHVPRTMRLGPDASPREMKLGEVNSEEEAMNAISLLNDAKVRWWDVHNKTTEWIPLPSVATRDGTVLTIPHAYATDFYAVLKMKGD